MLMTTTMPQDPLFPNLDDALDGEQAGRAFARALEGAGYLTRSLSCCVERSRVKQGRKALIGYRLHGLDVRGVAIDQRVMLALFPDGNASNLPDMSEEQRLVDPTFGPPTLTINDLAGQAWFFPNDRKVHDITKLLTADNGECEVVHYVPEQGCTVKLTCNDGLVLYGKCRADDRLKVAARVFAAAGETQAIRLAPVVSYDKKRRIIWQEAIAGHPLDPSDVCAQPRHWAGRIATALNAFHDLTPAADLKQLTYKSIGKTLASRIARLERGLPGAAARLFNIQAALEARTPNETSLALAHSDLHPGNLLWDGSSFALIDLDTAALAPRALDHGTLTATLIHTAVEADLRDAVIADMVNALRDAAQEELDDMHAFNWCVAASLIGERLYRCTTRLKSPRLIVRERLMDQAERLAQRHG